MTTPEKTIVGTTKLDLTNTKRRPMNPWDKDGVNGGLSSLSVVMTWLTKPSNFIRWEGSEESNSCTRESLCSEINRLLMKYGIKHRSNRDIRNRIQNVFYGFKRTQNWVKENERDSRHKLANKGVPAEQIDSIIRDKVKGMFSYYYILEPLINEKYSTDMNRLKSSDTDSDIDHVHDLKETLPHQASSLPSLMTSSMSTPKPTTLLASFSSSTTTVAKINHKNNKSIKRLGHGDYSRKRARRGIKRSNIYSILASLLESKVEIDKRRLDTEERRAQVEEKRLEAALLQKKAETQTAFIQAWKGLGLTNEQIIEKINEIWKNQ